jgi:oligopeptide/dipeptide ABC transporter ATP-binding protein
MAFLEFRNLKVYYQLQQGVLARILRSDRERVKAVDDVTFDVEEGEIFGVVGETGCGKTTLCKSLLLLVKTNGGKILLDDKNLLGLNPREVREFRREVQMIPQDPVGSLNPKMRIKDAVAEPLMAYSRMDPAWIERKVEELLKTVDLSPEFKKKYPFQLSGGEARRVTVARSLALRPRLMICDEPTSGLDVSVSAKIINVMKTIRDEFNLTYIWVSHNLHEINYISNRVLVMYLGKIVEIGKTSAIFERPGHPYTQGLLVALPKFTGFLGPTERKVYLRGEVPSPINPPRGCRFHPRCEHKKSICMETEPGLIEVEEGHQVACFL